MNKKDYRLPPLDLVSEDYKKILEEIPSKNRRNIIPLGIDSEGKIVYKKLSELEDILVGGTTTTGKTNFLNSIICSILMKHTPYETKLVLVDTKGVEFTSYTNIPHLLMPIVRKNEDTKRILNSLITGSINRKEIFKRNNCSTFDEYNNIVRKEKTKDPNTRLDFLPNIILIIDDFALIENEETQILIENLLKINNYTGIHVICGTSIPKEEVISPFMREYFLSRVSFHFVEDKDIRFILGSRETHQVDGTNNYIFKSNENKYYNLRNILLDDKEITTITDYLNFSK